jgi:hypothetical protein
VRVANLERYIEKVEKERDIAVKGVFWAEFMNGILDYRKKASRNCETSEDVKIYQGEIQAYDRILRLPEKLVGIIRERKQETA